MPPEPFRDSSVYGLTSEDIVFLRRLARDYRHNPIGGVQNVRLGQPTEMNSPYLHGSFATEVYVVKTPPTGIPAAYIPSLGSDEIIPGVAYCQVYSFVPDATGTMTGAANGSYQVVDDYILLVDNLSLEPIPGDTWLTVKKEKYERWVVDGRLASFVPTGTGTGTGTGGLDCCGEGHLVECITGALGVTIDDGSINTVSPALYIGHNSTGTVAFGFGTGIVWCLNTTGSHNVEAAYLDVTWTDITPTDSNRRTKYAISLRTASGGVATTTLVWDVTTARVRSWTQLQVSDTNGDGDVLIGTGDHYVEILGQATTNYSSIHCWGQPDNKFIALSMKERLSTVAEVFYDNAGSRKSLIGVTLATNRRTLFGLDADDLGTDPGADRFVKWDNTNKKFIFAP